MLSKQRNQTKPYQTKPYQTKPYQTKPYQTKPYQTKPYQTKPYQTAMVGKLKYLNKFQFGKSLPPSQKN